MHTVSCVPAGGVGVLCTQYPLQQQEEQWVPQYVLGMVCGKEEREWVRRRGRPAGQHAYAAQLLRHTGSLGSKGYHEGK